MEAYVKQFFEALEADRLPGQRCACCGRIRLGYVPVCDQCKAQRQEPVDLVKEGMLKVFSVRQHWDLEKRYQAEFPDCMVVGCVTLRDGPELWCAVYGIDTQQPERAFRQLPLPVDISIRRVAGNMIPVAIVRHD